MTETNQVAIIIAAYNAERTIARAVRSALAEPEVSQVLVVDDCSRDGTVAAARACDDGKGRLHILTQPVNAGPAAARNLALAACTGDWVGVLDADDFFLPGRMAALLAYADRADMIADDMWQVDAADVDGPRRALVGDEALRLPQAIDFATFVRSNVTDTKRERAELGFIKPLMRRATLLRHALSYDPDMRLGEDFELYARMLGHGARLLLVPHRGYVSVVRGDSLSGTHSEADLERLRDCDVTLAEQLPLKPEERAALRAHYTSVNCRLQWRLLILAVKERKLGGAMRCFTRSPAVTYFLLKQLGEQLCIRGKQRIAA